MLWAGIPHGSTSRSSTPLSTTIQLLKFFSPPLMNFYRGALLAHRPSHGITSAALPQLLAACNMLQLRLPPLPRITNPPKPILPLYFFTKNNRPLRTQTFGQPLPKLTTFCHTPQPRQIFILWSLHRLSLLPTSPTHLLLPPRPTPPPAAATSLSNKQPNADPTHWQYANFIPTPPVDQIPPRAGPSDFTSPIGGTPRSSRSKTPPRSTTPQRTRFSQGRSATQTDIRRGSPVPQPRATASTPFLPQPSHPPPTQQPPPYSTPPPPVQLPYAPPTPSASIPPVAHAWPAPYPTPKPAPPSLHIPQPAPQANVGQQQVYHLPNPQQHRGHVPLHAENYDPANDPWRAED